MELFKKTNEPLLSQTRFWVGLIGGLFVLGLFFEYGQGYRPYTHMPPSAKNVTHQEEEDASGKRYVEVFRFEGNGQKSSEPFMITGERFKIVYDCNGTAQVTLCQAIAYKTDTKMPQIIMNSVQSVADETVLYGEGEYYITSNSLADYSIVVYDFR